MSRRSSKRVSFSPDSNSDHPQVSLKHHPAAFITTATVTTTRQRQPTIAGILNLRPPSRLSPVRLLRSFRTKLSSAIRHISSSRTTPSLRRVSSSPSSVLMRSRSAGESIESHRAEAIEDCIEFLNSCSSSSLSRSNSVSTCSC